jgi:hypothetical protein
VEVVLTGDSAGFQLAYHVVKNSQKLDRFFTGFHFGHKKKSVRKCNKVKFQGFWVCPSTLASSRLILRAAILSGLNSS